jgi:hypothetical protein
VPQASIAWWYAATHGFAVGTVRSVPGNFTQVHLTNVPNTATYDVASALSAPAYTPYLSYVPEWDVTLTLWDEYTVKPAATVTSVVTRSAYSPIPPGKTFLQKEFESYNFDLNALEPATLAIPARNGTGYTAYVLFPLHLCQKLTFL